MAIQLLPMLNSIAVDVLMNNCNAIKIYKAYVGHHEQPLLTNFESRLFERRRPVPPHFSGKRWKGDSISSSDLRKVLPAKGVSFLYRGMVMSDAYPLLYYDVKDKDIIVVVPSESVTEQVISMTKDGEIFKERVRNIIDFPTSQEIARLRDIQITKIERRPKVYRRVCSSIATPIARTKSKQTFSLTPPRPPVNPSTAPLPAFWTNGDGELPITHLAPLSPLAADRQHSAPQFNSTVDQ